MRRIFMTCNDPNGVAECGKFRKSKNGSKKMEENRKSKSQRKVKKSDRSLTNNPDIESFHDQSSLLQLMEVSRGAQMLHKMIDSWLRGPKHNTRPEDIAKDLLKGSLDLQESVVKLRKLQEISLRTAGLVANQNEKDRKGKTDFKLNDKANHHQFSDQGHLMGFQRSWTSFDGSSWNCTEGLDSTSEIPSTSSSQSSSCILHTDRRFGSSFSSTDLKKERRPNVVAKLMGLEECSSKPLFPVEEKILNQKRPMFDIDMPKVRKNQSIVEKVDPKNKKILMREVLETTQFNGLLKKRSVKEPKLQMHHFNDLPPVFLMKPRSIPYEETVQEFSIRKLKEEAFPCRTDKCKEKMAAKGVNKRGIAILDPEENDFIEMAPNNHKLLLIEIDENSKVKNINCKPAEEKISEIKALDNISKTKAQKITNSKVQIKNQMKEKKPFADPEAAKPDVEQLGQEDKRIAIPLEGDCTEISNIRHEVASVYPSSNMSGEDCKRSQIKSEHESDGFLKHLLLTSQSFIRNAQELLDLNVDCNMILQKYETEGLVAANHRRLYLDCANEVIERKILKASQAFLPFLPTCAGNPRLHITLGGLVEEIHRAIENLKIYSDFSRQKLSEDNLRAMMERDIVNCNVMMNATWDWGWVLGFSADETEQVVNEVESLVLNGLIEEVFINL